MSYKDKETRNAKERMRYHACKKVGLCSECWHSPVVIGRVQCAACLLKHNNQSKKENREPTHKEYHRLTRERRYHRLRLQGKCYICGAPLTDGEGDRCMACKTCTYKIEGVLKYETAD